MWRRAGPSPCMVSACVWLCAAVGLGFRVLGCNPTSHPVVGCVPTSQTITTVSPPNTTLHPSTPVPPRLSLSPLEPCATPFGPGVSKCLENSYTRVLAAELSPTGIMCNACHPGDRPATHARPIAHMSSISAFAQHLHPACAVPATQVTTPILMGALDGRCQELPACTSPALGSLSATNCVIFDRFDPFDPPMQAMWRRTCPATGGRSPSRRGLSPRYGWRCCRPSTL